MRRIILWVVVLCMVPLSVRASDTLRTVSEFGRRIFQNLLISDTLNGNDRLDSTLVQRFVRDAVREVGNQIGMRKSTRVETVNKTAKYNVDAELIELLAVFVKYNRFLQPVEIVDYRKFLEAYASQGALYDTGSYAFCAQVGDSIILFPIPARVDTIMVEYYAGGSNLSTFADTVDLSHELYAAVEYLATGKAANALGDISKAQMAYSLYKMEKDYFLIEIYKRVKPPPLQIMQ